MKENHFQIQCACYKDYEHERKADKEQINHLTCA